MYEFRTRCSLADHDLFFLPVTSTTNLRQQARIPPPRRKAKKWAKTNQERGLSICYCSCRHSALVGWAAPRRVYLQWKSLHQVCTSCATVCTVNWCWFTPRQKLCKLVYTQFTHEMRQNWNKFTPSLQNPDRSLHEVCKTKTKVYTKFENTVKSLH